MTAYPDLSGNGHEDGSELLGEIKVETASSGDNTVVAAVPGKAIRVFEMRISCAGAVIVNIKKGSTELEEFNFDGNGAGIVLPLRDKPYYQTGANEALIINLSAAIAIDAIFKCDRVPA